MELLFRNNGKPFLVITPRESVLVKPRKWCCSGCVGGQAPRWCPLADEVYKRMNFTLNICRSKVLCQLALTAPLNLLPIKSPGES